MHKREKNQEPNDTLPNERSFRAKKMQDIPKGKPLKWIFLILAGLVFWFRYSACEHPFISPQEAETKKPIEEKTETKQPTSGEAITP